MPLMLAWTSDPDNAQVVFEDDGKVAYAYLLLGKSIVSDCWLYNVGEAPTLPEWPDPERMPYANPKRFITSEPFPEVTDAKDVSVRWHEATQGTLQADLFVRGQLHAVLRPGAKPGWCRLSHIKSPIARPLSELS